jgi:hypothetical protein
MWNIRLQIYEQFQAPKQGLQDHSVRIGTLGFVHVY